MIGPRGNTKWPKRMWALSNFGNLWSVFRTRREAIREAELQSGQPWKTIRRSMEVWPCYVRPVAQPRDYTEWHKRLIPVGEAHAAKYEGDDRPDIVTDVLNAFYAGAAWAAKNPPADESTA